MGPTTGRLARSLSGRLSPAAQGVELLAGVGQTVHLQRADGLADGPVGRARPAADHDREPGGKQLAQPGQLARQFRIVLRIHQAEGDDPRAALLHGAGDLKGRQVRPEVEDAPPEVGGERGEQQRAQLVQLAGRRGDHDGRVRRRGGVGRGGPGQPRLQDGAAKMLVRRGDFARAPEFPDALRQRRRHAQQHPLPAQHPFGAVQRLLERGRIEGLDRGKAAFEEGPGRILSGLGPGFAPRGLALGGGAFLGLRREVPECRRGQFGHHADALARLGELPQQQETLDVGVRVESAIGRRALRHDGSVSFFPNPDDVRAQARPLGHGLDRVVGAIHSLDIS